MKSTNILVITLFLFFGAACESFAQDEKPVRIKIMKDVDGEMKVFEKSYSSKEEMANDPEFKKFQEETGDSNIFIMPKKGNFTWSTDSSTNKFIVIGREAHSDGDHDIVISEDHVIQLGDGKSNTFVFKGSGEETSEADVFFFKGDSSKASYEFKSIDGPKKWVVRSSDAPMVTLRKIHAGRNISINDPSDNEIRSAGLSAGKALKPESIEYILDAAQGTLTVRMEAAKGSLHVSIANSDGNRIYAEELNNFDGAYSKTINLSGQEAGTYFLEIRQGQKALFKKIMID
ncbi:T9SS type A sorting domain-containing protein [Fulvivirga sedimenti]|uniref:T9SS type A sorting domain-containing protein n=1 Tax=Fulvivirga sedimenti TaxID=2879465 RepID=A0A9X1HW35_9BACT|nr:T9SS type A sorting domain-containing protein [Fulvivirga sedimenti]MCA6078460.1 T9SS type A sorting domain-containing protein [Fulvivirga sedimenti]